MRWQVEGGFLSFDSNQATVVVDSVVSGGRGTAAAPTGH
jgi:F-type H+-transporting ATPase subunit epsilon